MDKIAVSYSKGTYIKLNSTLEKDSHELSEEPIAEENDFLKYPAPQDLQRLVTRLDLANHIARNRYTLSIKELAKLLDITPIEVKKKKHPWQWRDWLIEPIEKSKWTLTRAQSHPNSSEANQND